MSATAPLLDEIDAALEGQPNEKRLKVLRRVADLFVERAGGVTEAQLGLFDDIFEQLTKEVEQKGMLELSDRFAALENAPERLIRRLASDDSIEISGPVLANSGALDTDDILEIARTQSLAHLEAIAGRADIGEDVTDVLVDRGDMTVARKVAANSGARFSEDSLQSLVNLAGNDSDLANAVARRRELPPEMFRNLLSRASDSVRKRLMETANPATAKAINRILTEGAAAQKAEADAVAVPVAAKRNYRDAKRAVMDAQKNGGITPDTLLQFAKAMKFEEVLVMFSAMTGVSLDVIDRLLEDPSDDPLMIMGKAIDLDWNIMLPVIAARTGTPELRESRADEANKKYRKLSAYSAQRVMRFWQQREKAAAGK
jgi:uncharacterized protein (DUF2336 family)